MELKTLLEELAASKIVRVTGSFADGTETEESDIDFYVKADKNVYRIRTGERNIEKVNAIVQRHGIQLRSTLPGYIFTHMTSGNGYLPRQLEFSDLFHHRPNRMKEREIEGIIFKTW